MLEAGIVQLLLASEGVTDLVSDRVWPVKAPTDQPVYPYCVYRDITSGHELTLDSIEAGHKLIQFDVFASLYGDCKSVLKALRDVLVGFSGNLPDGTRVLIATRGNEMDNFDYDGQKVYHSLAEYEFEYVEV